MNSVRTEQDIFEMPPRDGFTVAHTRCYIRDPDGYIIEVGQSKPDFKYG